MEPSLPDIVCLALFDGFREVWQVGVLIAGHVNLNNIAEISYGLPVSGGLVAAIFDRNPFTKKLSFDLLTKLH